MTRVKPAENHPWKSIPVSLSAKAKNALNRIARYHKLHPNARYKGSKYLKGLYKRQIRQEEV